MVVFSIMFYEGLKFKKVGIYGAKQHYRYVVLHCRARIHTNCGEPQVILFASKHNHTSATGINNPDREDKKQESTKSASLKRRMVLTALARCVSEYEYLPEYKSMRPLYEF